MMMFGAQAWSAGEGASVGRVVSNWRVDINARFATRWLVANGYIEVGR